MRTTGLVVLIGLLQAPAGGSAREARHYLPTTIQFPDRANGFAELRPTTACPSCPLRIQRTRDGGKTWRGTSLAHLPRTPAEQRFRASWRNGTMPGLRLASVVSREIAWGTWQLQVFISRDAGHLWHQVRVPCSRPYAFRPPLISAVSARHAWLLCLGQPGVGQQNKALYETSDGRTWVLRKNLSGSGYGERLAFSRAGFGLLAESRGGLLVTRDGGRSWKWAASIASPEEAEPQSIVLVSPGEGLVLVRNDRLRRKIELFRTRNAGQTWRLLHAWR